MMMKGRIGIERENQAVKRQGEDRENEEDVPAIRRIKRRRAQRVRIAGIWVCAARDKEKAAGG